MNKNSPFPEEFYEHEFIQHFIQFHGVDVNEIVKAYSLEKDDINYAISHIGNNFKIKANGECQECKDIWIKYGSLKSYTEHNKLRKTLGHEPYRKWGFFNLPT